MANPFEKLKSWGEKTWQRNIIDPLQAAGKSIDREVIRPTTDAIGLTAAPIDPASVPKLDPARVQAMAEYGEKMKVQGAQFDPSVYGPDFFAPQYAAGQTTENQIPMPGQYQQRPATAVIPGQQAMPDSPAASYAPTAERGQALTAFSAPIDAPNAPGRISAANVPQTSGISRPMVPGMTNAPTAPAQTTAPQMSNVSGINPNLQSYQGNANLSQSQAAIANEMARLSNPQQLTAGFDKNMRDSSVALSTSGLKQQKDAAMAQLKEQQMASGNYGSSVAQKQMMDLQQDYDRQINEAGMAYDVRQNEASREDRYRNIDVENTRSNMLLNAAGARTSTELAGQGFARDTASMNNSVEALKAEFARQGKTIDNNTAMQMAQFAVSQDQQGFANAMASAGFNSQEAQQMYQNQVSSQNMSEQQTQQQFINEMTAKGFTAQQAQQEYQNKMNNASFQAGESQRGFGNTVTATQFNNQVGQNQFANEMAKYGANTQQEQQRFMNEMLRLGYSDAQAQQMYQNQVGADARNVAGDKDANQDAWNRYTSGQENARYKDAVASEKERYNIGQTTDAKTRQYNAYTQNAAALADYGRNSLDPQSVIDAEARQRQEAEKNARLAGTIDLAGKAISYASGVPAGSVKAPAPVGATSAAPAPGNIRGNVIARQPVASGLSDISRSQELNRRPARRPMI